MTRFLIPALALLALACSPRPATQDQQAAAVSADTLRYPEETHLRNVRQLTFGGDNAEAYFSFDNQYLTFQRTNKEEGVPCDQIFYGKIPTAPGEAFDFRPVSNGKGRTTCSYFYPGGDTIVFASTHSAGDDCPPEPSREQTGGKYVWPLYESFELYLADRQGQPLQRLTDNAFYDAEATISPRGDLMVFTSTRNGDIDLYTMRLDGSEVRQVTDELGYDGGAFFSPDGSKLIFRASRPRTEAEVADYKALLAQGLVAPTNMELFVCNVDGSDLRQITQLGSANWAPYFHPSGERVIFSSNHASGGRTFNLYSVKLDGSDLQRITHDSQFDAFPMFSHDGRHLVFSSNRNNGGTRSTNLFIAEWVE
ncbi:MAG: hypothetical protein OHK0039_46480 [Bacteroidia bacterium]